MLISLEKFEIFFKNTLKIYTFNKNNRKKNKL